MRTFADIPKEFARKETARAVLIPVAFDLTSTWGKGADRGPDAFLEAARNMELYDIATDSEPYRCGIFLSDPPEDLSGPDRMVESVEKLVSAWLDAGRLVTLIGGEHSVSIGAIRAFARRYPDLSVLQLDAHADLRPEYEGSPFNHACALHEASQTAHLVQVGIRSMDLSEKEFLEPDRVFYAEQIARGPLDWMDRVVETLAGPVYITIDLDVFDPAYVPSTGTPEPGGLDWYTVVSLLERVCRRHRVVGFDVVELCPHPSNRAPDLLAAKLYYRLLAWIFKERQ